MTLLIQRAIIVGILFIPVVISGFWLMGKGNPPPTLLLTIHKFAVLGNMFLLNKTFLDIKKTGFVNSLDWTVMIVMNVLFVVAILSGGLLSMNKEFPSIIKIIHLITPWMTIVVSGLLLYLLGK